MKSVWQETAARPKIFPMTQKQPLDQTEADAIVIGGGLAGMLTAFFLQEQGVRTIVLEADKVGSGQTGHTTAKVTAQHGLIYDNLITNFGVEAAQQYAYANRRAIQTYEKMIQKYQIDCGWQVLPAYLYSTKSAEPLKREAEAAARLGFQVKLSKETTLPFPVKGALSFADQAQFHPLKFLYQIAVQVPVYEHTKVVKAKGRHLSAVHCGKRIELEARYIIFATHFPFVNFPGLYFARMYQERSYVVAVEHAADLGGMYLGVDRHPMSFRNNGSQLLVGGGKHRTGENSAGGQYRMLHHKAGAWWPECKEVSRWSAQDCMTLDQIPYIGRFSEGMPDWYVATGFGKWGMTTSMAAARMISAEILGKDNPYQVFSPNRKHWKASAGNLVSNTMKATKNLTRQYCTLPKETLDDIKPGCGGIVNYNGKKTGVYKDKKGEIYTVTTRCPHLGCQLDWNPEEKSWDCPCHGSRFDYRGKLLDNPAQGRIGRT